MIHIINLEQRGRNLFIWNLGIWALEGIYTIIEIWIWIAYGMHCKPVFKIAFAIE